MRRARKQSDGCPQVLEWLLVTSLVAEDLRVETYQRGAGLHVYPSSRSSWVRITHVPSGIVAESDYYRSQLRNREEALAILRSRLEQSGWAE